MTGVRGQILTLNPVYHMLAVTRSPLLGQPTDSHSLVFLLVMGLAGWISTFFLYAAVRRRIVHYL